MGPLEIKAAWERYGLSRYGNVRHETSVDLFKIRYWSTDAWGQPTVLSGLIQLPAGGAPRGLLLYCHGTIGNRNLAPSRFNGTDPEMALVAAIFASHGYAVMVPDYIGLGDDLSVHPFPEFKLDSNSAVDLIRPGMEAIRSLHQRIGKNFFVAGYSEGGAVAMWAIRKLEGQVRITAGVPMAGPYDLSGVTTSQLLRPQNVFNLAAKLFHLSYSALWASERDRSHELQDYFVPSFATYIPRVLGMDLSLTEMCKKLFFKGIQVGAITSVSRALTPKFQDMLRHPEKYPDFYKDLRQNDCYDWKTRTPMRLVYLVNDGVVPPENTIEAENFMDKRFVSTFAIEDRTLNHVTAIPASFFAALSFFESFASRR